MLLRPPEGQVSPHRPYDLGMTKLVGINHVALEVGDVDEALAWYGRFFDFELRAASGVCDRPRASAMNWSPMSRKAM